VTTVCTATYATGRGQIRRSTSWFTVEERIRKYRVCAKSAVEGSHLGPSPKPNRPKIAVLTVWNGMNKNTAMRSEDRGLPRG
jgi:hypothetical protein